MAREHPTNRDDVIYSDDVIEAIAELEANLDNLKAQAMDCWEAWRTGGEWPEYVQDRAAEESRMAEFLSADEGDVNQVTAAMERYAEDYAENYGQEYVESLRSFRALAAA